MVLSYRRGSTFHHLVACSKMADGRVEIRMLAGDIQLRQSFATISADQLC